MLKQQRVHQLLLFTLAIKVTWVEVNKETCTKNPSKQEATSRDCVLTRFISQHVQQHYVENTTLTDETSCCKSEWAREKHQISTCAQNKTSTWSITYKSWTQTNYCSHLTPTAKTPLINNLPMNLHPSHTHWLHIVSSSLTTATWHMVGM